MVAERVIQSLWTSENIAQRAVILVGNKADLARSRVITSEGKHFIHVIFFFCVLLKSSRHTSEFVAITIYRYNIFYKMMSDMCLYCIMGLKKKVMEG